MAEIGNPAPTPNVGIRGNQTDLPVLQKKEGLHAEVGQPNFVSALNGLATTPTALGELGSRLTQAAGQSLAMSWGQEMGKNPHGNLLPPISDFDKHVADSYSSQSQVTLGLEANSMLLKAQDELSKLNKITPEVIASYTQNMAAGLDKTLQAAPNNIKPQLQNQFGYQLLQSSHSLTQKMNAQNKARANEESAVWRTHKADQMANAYKDGDTETGDKLNESVKQNIINQKAANIMSPAAAETALKSLHLSAESSKIIKKGMDAHAKGTEAEFLASIADKKIPGLSWSESETVRNNAVHYFAQQDAALAKQQALSLSEGQYLIANNEFDDSVAALYQEKLEPAAFNKLMTQFAIQQKKQGVAQTKLNGMISFANDYRAFEGASAKDINNTFDTLTQSAILQSQNNGKPISLEEAQFQTASYMATPVPKFIDSINRAMSAGNPHQVLQAMESFERLHAQEGFKTTGVDAKAQAMGEVFKDLLASNPADIDEALKKAREDVYNKDDATIKLNNVKINEYMNKHANTSQMALSNAIKLGGLESHNLANPSEYQNDVYSRFRGYMQLTNGNETQAKELVAKDIGKIWGTTKVNGKPEITRLPVEKVIGMPEGATALILSDMANQLAPQFEEGKKSFDNGTSPFYYRIKPRISFEEYSAKKMAMNNLGLKNPTYAQNLQLIRKYEAGEQVEVEQIFRGKEFKARPNNFIEEGNINIYNRPKFENPDKSISTVRSISFEEDGKEILVPTITKEGKSLSEKEAIKLYHSTGEHLGKFNSVKEANEYAGWLHNQQNEMILGKSTGEVKTLKLNIKTTPYATINPKTGQIMGGYNITHKDDKTGFDMALPGYYGPTKSMPEYNPNARWISENYKAVNGLGNKSFLENKSNYLQTKRARTSSYSLGFDAQQMLRENNG